MNFHFLYSYRFHLFVLVLIVIVPTLIMTAFFGFEGRKLAKEQVIESQTEITRNIALQESAVIENAKQLVELLAQVPDVRQGDKESCQRFVRSIALKNPQYLNLGSVNLDGDIVCSSLDIAAPINVSDRPYIKKAFETHDLAVGEYQIGRTTGRPSLNLAYPIFDVGGSISGLTVVAVDLGWLTKVLENLKLPPEYTFTVIDRNAVVLSRYPEYGNWVGKVILEEPLYKAIAKGQGESSFEAVGLDNVKRIYLVNRFGQETGEVYMALGISTRAVFGETDDILIKFMLGLLFVSFLGLTTAFFFARRFLVEPVDNLVKMTELLGQGKLEVRTSSEWRRGDLGRLARAFDQMAQSLEDQITKIKRAKEFEENQLRNEVKLEEREKDFISVASHELQTPLALIRGYMSMLVSGKYGKVDAEAKKYVAESLEGTDRLVKLVRDLLITSRIGDDRLRLGKTSFDLVELINGVIFNFQKVAKQAGLALSYKGAAKIRVKADRDRTIEIITNLVDNAIKYTKRGGVVVSVSKVGNFAEVAVADSGVGIKKSVLPHIFDKFYFSEALVSKQQESTGLGLYIVKSLVEALGGTIRVESKEGQGSTFTFTLPLSETNA